MSGSLRQVSPQPQQATWRQRRAIASMLCISVSVALGAQLVGTIALSQPSNSPSTERSDTSAAETVARSTLKPGSRGSDVTELQATLKLLGYYDGTVDGVYGKGTGTAVSQFQQAAGLSPDGIVGPATWNRLFPPTAEASTPASSSSATSPSPSTSSAASFPVPSGVTSAPSPRPSLSPSPKPTGPSKPAQNRPADDRTRPTPTSESTILPVLRQGMKGSAVAALQSRLRAIGLFKGTIDGVFGAETLAAVKVAQQRFKLDPDGVVGPSTWSALLR